MKLNLDSPLARDRPFSYVKNLRRLEEAHKLFQPPGIQGFAQKASLGDFPPLAGGPLDAVGKEEFLLQGSDRRRFRHDFSKIPRKRLSQASLVEGGIPSQYRPDQGFEGETGDQGSLGEDSRPRKDPKAGPGGGRHRWRWKGGRVPLVLNVP